MDGNPISGLYPTPQTNQPQSIFSGNPLALIPAISQIQDLTARNALGRAAQDATTGGLVDPSRATAAAAANPAAARLFPEFVGTMQQQRQQQLEYTATQSALASRQNQELQNYFAGLLATPGATPASVTSLMIAHAARNPQIPAAMYTSLLQGMPQGGGKAMQNYGAQMSNAARGAEATAVRVQGPPGPGGEAQTITSGAATAAGTVPTGLPPGVAEAQQKVKEVSAAQYAGDLADSANYARQIFPLQKAIPALDALGKTGTGPGTEQRNHIVSFLQSLGVPGIDQNNIKSYDEANKYLTDWVNANGNISTNDKLAAAFAGNPSTKISNAAAGDVAKSALALRAMKQAQLKNFQATGLPGDQYSQWSADNWSGKLDDPRAYGVPLMSNSAKQSLDKSLTDKTERLKFLASLKAAKAGQVDNPIPGYSNAGQP